ncbi:TetR family transcriptional regulator [Actinocatenispora thailandica]|uniref:TetR family transcriptional regulator n=1 Tax=Actinocatenispora thailandica TaxID=227318 RepID=A0A7R7DMZ7_9ACTN|nr:TetR family transcriptional regulator [Actinocatenispora thailandica]BCJ34720.1 TetR family transcriptional regulator [Actinocatenispora thailandica]
MRNGARRAALLDAAIEVVARHGGHGLTLRAVDAAAAVPPGTTSNYFRSRADLLRQATDRIGSRLRPDVETLLAAQAAAFDPGVLASQLRRLVAQSQSDPGTRMAALELALAATRDPALRGELGDGTDPDTDRAADGDRAAHEDREPVPPEPAGAAVFAATLGLLIDELAVPEVMPCVDAVIAGVADGIGGTGGDGAGLPDVCSAGGNR